MALFYPRDPDSRLPVGPLYDTRPAALARGAFNYVSIGLAFTTLGSLATLLIRLNRQDLDTAGLFVHAGAVDLANEDVLVLDDQNQFLMVCWQDPCGNHQQLPGT
jgi:hypothetical protein